MYVLGKDKIELGLSRKVMQRSKFFHDGISSTKLLFLTMIITHDATVGLAC